MNSLRPHSLASVLTSVALPPPGSCTAAPSPKARILPHELAFSKSVPAPALQSAASCGEALSYRCFKVSGLPKGKTAHDLVATVRAAFGPSSDLDQLTRAYIDADGELCIDPDGTGDDGIGSPYTGTPTSCLDGSVAISYDPELVGDCCFFNGGVQGYLVQNLTNQAYMSCKTTNFAFYRCPAADSADSAYPPGKATDNDETTYWKAADTAANHYVEIDFGTAINLTGVAFNFRQAPSSGTALAYKVQTSTNSLVWTTKGTASANHVWQNRNWGIASARWIRITVTSLPAGWSASIGSIRVF